MAQSDVAERQGNELILVVDDEASIRRILETRLSMIGYQVVTACDDAFASRKTPVTTR